MIDEQKQPDENQTNEEASIPSDAMMIDALGKDMPVLDDDTEDADIDEVDGEMSDSVASVDDEVDGLDENLAQDDALDVETLGNALDVDATDVDVSDADLAGLDIDAALAAISDLTVLGTNDADADIDEDLEYDDIEDGDDAPDTDGEYDGAPEVVAPVLTFARPPTSSLKRGQIASVLPALMLVIGGFGLMYLVVSDVIIEANLLLVICTGLIGLSFVAHWLSSRRWAQGSLWVGLMLILSAGAVIIWQQPDNHTLWYLLPLGWALACFVTAVLGHTNRASMLLATVFFGVVGGGSWLIASGSITPALMTTFASLAPLVFIVLIILVIVPTRRA